MPAAPEPTRPTVNLTAASPRLTSATADLAPLSTLPVPAGAGPIPLTADPVPPAPAARPAHPARPAVEPAFGLWTRDDWLNDALRAAVEHAWHNWPVQFLLTDIAEWRPGAGHGLLADDAPLRVSAMGRGFTELHVSGRTFGAGVGRAGSLTPAQRHRAQRHEAQQRQTNGAGA